MYRLTNYRMHIHTHVLSLAERKSDFQHKIRPGQYLRKKEKTKRDERRCRGHDQQKAK